MKYYTIQNNEIFIADNEQVLIRFYDNILPLPEDYEEGKYIVSNGELIFNPNWEEEKARRERQRLHQLTITPVVLSAGVILCLLNYTTISL